MSQSGILDIEQNCPQIPTLFTCDQGSAIPIGNELVVDGLTVANGTYAKPVFTTGAGNQVDVNVQVSTGLGSAPSDKLDAGLSSFDSSQFTVTEHGFVSLIGGGVGIDSVTPDDGNVVSADGSGNINYLADTVANGTYSKPLYTTGTPASNLITPNIQVSTQRTGAPADFLDAGICSFDDNAFDVSAFGYVTLSGGGTATVTMTGDDGVAVTPDGSGNFNWIGVAVANATHAKPVYFKDSSTPNALDLDIQVSAAVTGAPGDKNDAGICSFDDVYFTCDADGYVTFIAPTQLQWVEVTGTSQAMAINTGYIANNAGLVTLTLPSTAAVGDIVRVTGKGAGGWRMAQNAGQSINFGSLTTTTGAGGRLDSNNDYDSVELVCITADTVFNVLSSQGVISVT